MIFTRKVIDCGITFKLYNQELERVKHLNFLGLWFDERITWAVYI